MDQYLSTVIIALITGIFSIITLVIQKKQDKVINQINEQTTFIEKEKVLKQKITDKEKERQELIHQIMILTLDTNLYILQNTDVGGDLVPTDDVLKKSNEIKQRFDAIGDDIEELQKEYKMVLELTTEIQRQVQAEQSKKK